MVEEVVEIALRLNTSLTHILPSANANADLLAKAGIGQLS